VENGVILKVIRGEFFAAKKCRIFVCFLPQKNIIFFEFSLLFSPYNGII
jgi:hypothetical protein